jgi:TetR/AcrR family transcriptional regulator, transcriptional repressor for nem operon
MRERSLRKSKAEAAETRRRIVETAAAEFKRNGIHATALADVMTAAGLTQGGFYRHFDSKDQLVREAVAEGMRPVVEFARDAAADRKGEPALKKIIRSYLSRDHRRNPASGCALSALGSELAREDAEARRVTTKAVRELVDIVAEQYAVAGEAGSREQAILAVSALVGAMTLSRVVAEPKLASEILRSTAERLMPPFETPPASEPAAIA